MEVTTSAPAPAAPTSATASSSSPAPVSTPAPAKASAGNTEAPYIEGVTEGEAPKPPVAETPAEKKARKYKIKVDGVEEEIDLDTMSDEDLVKSQQWAKAARKRMQQASETEKQFRSIMDAIKNDPFEALRDPAFGVDLQKLAEDRLIREYEEKQMSPEQRERQALQRELESYKSREQQAKEFQEQERQAFIEKQVFEQTEKEFMEALDSAGLPKTHETLYMMAEVAKLNLTHGIELTPAQLAAEVQDRVSGMNKGVLSGLKGEKLAKYLGDDVVKEVLRFSVERARAGNKPPPTANTVPADAQGGPGTPQTYDRTKHSATEWRKFMRGE